MSVEQQINLKFLVRLRKTPTEALNLLKKSMVMTQCQELVFLSGTGGSKREEGRWKMITGSCGRPSTSRTDENVERVRQKVRNDNRLTVTMIADELGMNSERVWRIITEDLGMRKICAKMVPRLLNEGQTDNRTFWSNSKFWSNVCKCVKTIWSNSKLNPTC